MVDLETTVRLLATPAGAAARAAGLLVVGESGIFTLSDVRRLAAVDVGAVLVGEALVKQSDPETGVKRLYGKA